MFKIKKTFKNKFIGISYIHALRCSYIHGTQSDGAGVSFSACSPVCPSTIDTHTFTCAILPRSLHYTFNIEYDTAISIFFQKNDKIYSCATQNAKKK